MSSYYVVIVLFIFIFCETFEEMHNGNSRKKMQCRVNNQIRLMYKLCKTIPEKKPNINCTYSEPQQKQTRLNTFTERRLSEEQIHKSIFPRCRPEDLGPYTSKFRNYSIRELNAKFPQVMYGGRYSPKECEAQDKVAIIVPYRNRTEHLRIFLGHMHPFLLKQQINYRIFIVEQADHYEFNRAKLFNIGFDISQKITQRRYKCYIFHDIDLLPEDSRNLYSCAKQPRHLSVIIDGKKRYPRNFGGVSALTERQFVQVNGFSNIYWGWGGEDDDMANRVQAFGYKIIKNIGPSATYVSLNHTKALPNTGRFDRLVKGNNTLIIKNDGLSTLEYTLVNLEMHRLFTHVIAYTNIGRKISVEAKHQHNKPPSFNNSLIMKLWD